MKEVGFSIGKAHGREHITWHDKDEMLWAIDLNGEASRTYRTDFRDFHRMKLVPLDAWVINGVSAMDLRWFFGNIKTTPNHPEYDSLMEIFNTIVRQLPWLAPPFAEPKEFSAVVTASYKGGSRSRYVFNGARWFRENDFLNTYEWSDLTNPTKEAGE